MTDDIIHSGTVASVRGGVVDVYFLRELPKINNLLVAFQENRHRSKSTTVISPTILLSPSTTAISFTFA